MGWSRTPDRSRLRSLVIAIAGTESIARLGFADKADGLALDRELGVMMST
jgi:hypothetical protein